MTEIHADRRPPSEPEVPLDLDAAGRELLEEARSMASGRAAKSLTPGAHAPLTQTLLTLTAGHELGAHQANGPATIYLLRGAVTITSDNVTVDLRAGDWARIPTALHNLRADEDVVALLTVAPTTDPPRD